MSKGFVCENCYECCYNAPVSHKEIVAIRRALRKMPIEELKRLRDQPRDKGLCPLVDVENKRCSVYDARPDTCRKFGFVERLQCSYNKHVKLTPFKDSIIDFMAQHSLNGIDTEFELGVLGVDYTWEDGLIKFN